MARKSKISIGGRGDYAALLDGFFVDETEGNSMAILHVPMDSKNFNGPRRPKVGERLYVACEGIGIFFGDISKVRRLVVNELWVFELTAWRKRPTMRERIKAFFTF